MKKLSIGVIAILLVGFILAGAQQMTDEFPRAQALFARAQRLMSEKNYPAAIDAYNELVKGFKNSKYRDVYHYGLARAYYLSGNFKKAAQALAPYDALFPGSKLQPYAYQLEANSNYRLAQLEEAFRGYIRAYETANDSRLRSLSEQSLLAEVESGYIPNDSLVAVVPASLRCQVKARVAFLMTNYWDETKIDDYLAGCPKSSPVKEKKPQVAKGELAIGLMLPLNGPYAKYGQSILDGAMLASEAQKARGTSIELLAYDTQADNVTAAREAMALADANVNMVVGPLLSNVAATAAAALSCRQIPLLVPAATQAGFTDLSPVCFQMSANMETIGRGMAQYAVKHRGMTTLAVIMPTTIDEMTMGDAFAAEAARLGAHVLAVEKFRPDETDFGPYINDIKEAILGPPVDSVFYLTLDGDTLKPGEMPVAFDGLFLPATEQQLFLLLPQLNFYRVTTSYLGADEWNTAKVLQLGEKVLKDAVFYSSEAAMINSPAYDAFAASYDAKYAAAPTRLVAVGFDAVNILAEAYRAGQQAPADLAEYLKSLAGYDGASGRMTFGLSRTNLELPLFTLREDQVRPLIERPVVEEVPEEELPPDSVTVDTIIYEY